MNTMSAPIMISATTVKNTVYLISAFCGFPVPNIIPRTSTIIPPRTPMRLIIALAFERRGFGVTSGMSATAGERKRAIDMSSTISTATKIMTAEGATETVLAAYACLAGLT